MLELLTAMNADPVTGRDAEGAQVLVPPVPTAARRLPVRRPRRAPRVRSPRAVRRARPRLPWCSRCSWMCRGGRSGYRASPRSGPGRSSGVSRCGSTAAGSRCSRESMCRTRGSAGRVSAPECISTRRGCSVRWRANPRGDRERGPGARRQVSDGAAPAVGAASERPVDHPAQAAFAGHSAGGRGVAAFRATRRWPAPGGASAGRGRAGQAVRTGSWVGPAAGACSEWSAVAEWSAVGVSPLSGAGFRNRARTIPTARAGAIQR